MDICHWHSKSPAPAVSSQQRFCNRMKSRRQTDLTQDIYECILDSKTPLSPLRKHLKLQKKGGRKWLNKKIDQSLVLSLQNYDN